MTKSRGPTQSLPEWWDELDELDRAASRAWSAWADAVYTPARGW